MTVHITLERLRELLSYDDLTGEFRWAVSRGPNSAGSIAGTNSDGYRQIKVDGVLYKSHRLVWFWAHGEWPAEHIDHRNGIRNDNRIVNLRQATPSQNMQNVGKYANNTSGLTRVSWHKQRKKWRADIKLSGRQKFLGYFDSQEEAHDAYLAAKAEMHDFQPAPRTNVDERY
jgi:hypothetical protein